MEPWANDFGLMDELSDIENPLSILFFSIRKTEPSGKPRVTAAHNTSSTSLYLSWQPPDLATIHGEFLGYLISYRPRDVGDSKAVEIPIDNPKATVNEFLILHLFSRVGPSNFEPGN